MKKKINLKTDFASISDKIETLDYEERIRYAYDLSDGHLAVGVSGGPESLLLIDSVLHINENILSPVGRPIKLVCVDIPGTKYDEQRDYIQSLKDCDIPIDTVPAHSAEDKKEAMYRYLQSNNIATVAYGKRREQSRDRVDMPFIENDSSYERDIAIVYPCADMVEADVHKHIDFLKKDLQHPLYKQEKTRDGRVNDDVFNAPVCALRVGHG